MDAFTHVSVTAAYVKAALANLQEMLTDGI